MNAAERRLHERTLELAASAIDFDLTSAESVDLEAHLATCTSCGRDAAGLRADALAIRPPVTLMPSQRVDDAVRREIARGGARPQRFLLLAATALILVGLLAAVAVGAALLRTQETLPMTVVPTDRAAVADPVPNASPTLGESWRTLDVPGGSSGRLIEAVTIAGAGLVGVGRGGCDTDAAKDPTACFGAAWTAGADWSITAVPDQDGLRVGLSNPTSGPEKGIYDVAFGPNGIVAVGYPLDPDIVGRPGIWRSPDGRTWQRARVDFGPPSLGVRLSAIGASERGYVAVGSLVDGTRAQGPDITARAAAWVSGDGVTWTRAADTADMNVGPCLDTLEEPSCGGMLGISPSGDGFVAVGYARTDSTPAAQIRPAAWTSADGLAWIRSDTGLDVAGSLSDVTQGGPGLVAVGSICQPDCFGPASVGLVATSADGSTWAFAPVGEASALEAIASAGSRLFAVGARNQDVDLPAELQVWQSDDGLDWRRVAGVPNLRDASSYPGLDIAATEDRVVVVGWAGVGANGDLQNFAFVGSTSGPTAGPQPTASAATPPPTDPIASAIDPEVMLRVEIRPDASVGRMPSLTVYRDGSVLRRDDASGRITRLTPSGLALLLAPATESDLLAASGELGSDPAYQGGRTTYTIELRRGQEIVRRETTNSMAPATRSEAERIIALAEHLDDLESWLPEDVWATKPAAFEPFVASNYLLKVTSFKQPGVDYPAQALDRADVDWPLPGTLEGFGDLPDVEQPLGPGTTSRCGVLTLAEAAAVKRSLAAAPFVPMGERLQADLDWAPSIGHVTVSLIPLLPEDPLDCAVDLSWP